MIIIKTAYNCLAQGGHDGFFYRKGSETGSWALITSAQDLESPLKVLYKDSAEFDNTCNQCAVCKKIFLNLIFGDGTDVTRPLKHYCPSYK